MITTAERELFTGLEAGLATEDVRAGAGGLAVIGATGPDITYPGDATEELVAARAHLWTPKPPGVQVVKGCGDDRPLTAESAERVNAFFQSDRRGDVTLDVNEGYARVYGGAAGIAKNILIAGSVMHGPEFIERVGGLAGMMDMVDNVTDGRALIHSDDKHEGRRDGFNREGGEAVGCLYCNALGATCALHAGDSPVNKANGNLIPDTAYADQFRYFDTDELTVETLIKAQAHVGESLAAHTDDGDPMSYSFGRSRILNALARRIRPVAILDGPHAKVRDTLLINSYHLDRIGNPRAAREEGLDFYAGDVAVVTDDIGPLLQEHDIPPQLFMQAVDMDTAPVRAALVANDKDEDLKGNYDPSHLMKAVVGDPREAAKALQDKYGN